MARRPVKKSVPPGPWGDGLPSHLPSRRQESDYESDTETESVMSGFIPVEANQEQVTTGGFNNNDEFLKTDLKSREANSAYIYSWVPRLVDGKLCIEGDLLDFDEDDDACSVNTTMAEKFISGPVIDRVNGVMFKTGNKTYVLEGSMAVGVIEDEKDEYTPYFVRDKFRTCIPENWEILVKQWKRIKSKNVQNRQTMSMIYESLLSFSKSSDNTSNRSCDASVFSVSSTEPPKDWNLSLNKQPAIDIGPCASPGSPQKAELEDFEEQNDDNHSVVTEDPHSQDDDDDALSEKDEDIESIAQDDMDLDIPKGDNVEVEVSVNEDDSNQKMDVSSLRQWKRHKTNVNETLNFEDDRTFCRSCNMTFVNYKSHYGSKYHQKVVEEQETCPEIIGPNPDYDDPDMMYTCEACRFSTDDSKIMKAHIDLKNHKMKITKRDQRVVFCNLCNCSFTRDNMFSKHLNTKTHKSRMQEAGTMSEDERTTTINRNMGKLIKKSRVRS